MPISSLRLLALASALAVLTGCAVELHHALAEEDANDIYVLLSENGIGSKKVKEEGGNEPTYMIAVGKQDAAQAAKLLREYSLPRPKHRGLKIFVDKKGMIPTSTEERAMFLDALGSELSMALNKIDGVLDARAIVMIPESNDLTQPDRRPLPSASILVKYRPMGEGRSPLNEEQIRRFVASAVPEMRPDAVTVILSQALPPQATSTAEGRLQDVLGLRMTAASAGQFKVGVAIVALLILAMAAFTTMNLLRSGGGPAKARPRPKPED
jgi:type III secretion protein J